jgi:hypothetical protein
MQQCHPEFVLRHQLHENFRMAAACQACRGGPGAKAPAPPEGNVSDDMKADPAICGCVIGEKHMFAAGTERGEMHQAGAS